MRILVEGELSRTGLTLNGLLWCRLVNLEFGEGLAEIVFLYLFRSVGNAIHVSTVGTAKRLCSGHKPLDRPTLFAGELSLCNDLIDARQVSLLERCFRGVLC